MHYFILTANYQYFASLASLNTSSLYLMQYLSFFEYETLCEDGTVGEVKGHQQIYQAIVKLINELMPLPRVFLQIRITASTGSEVQQIIKNKK